MLHQQHLFQKSELQSQKAHFATILENENEKRRDVENQKDEAVDLLLLKIKEMSSQMGL